MKTLVTTPKSCWKENPHHLAVETYFFTWDFDHFWEFKKTGTPLPCLGSIGAPLFHAKGVPWHSVFNIKGAPLLVGGNHGESHLLLRDNSERMGFVWLESYSMALSKEIIITYGAISSTNSKNTQGG
jgi:hypothetical protein